MSRRDDRAQVAWLRRRVDDLEAQVTEVRETRDQEQANRPDREDDPPARRERHPVREDPNYFAGDRFRSTWQPVRKR
jgi:hypothetical protein